MKIIFCLVACCLPLISATAAAVSATDDRGVRVELKQPAERVASISTFGADLLLALGVKPVAVTQFGPFAKPDYLADQLVDVPVIGSRSQVSMEMLSEVSPDLTLAIRRYTEQNAEKFNDIAPYAALNLITLDDSLRAVSFSGALLGRDADARALNQDFTAMLEQYKKKAPGGLSAALLVTGGEVPFTYHDHFLTAQLLSWLNVKNTGGKLSTQVQGLPLGYRVRLENLLQQDPDIIFLFQTNKERAFTQSPIWPYLKAVQAGRVYEVGQHWKEAAGPTARSLVFKEMAHRIYPDIFPMPTLPESMRSKRYK
ncbi:ABC transporter substrate-binding protein [Oceanospirillum linum]|uniref:Ferrichrome ABC transporter substrate-binding protein n=1 Tax=Oceanospirillum linum TaxID=966 RepID=A0A1T1H9A4_OCELI|nr:ABC transporter substrate-binding protein [Oceanospirillum linum]OOV86428.1 ferrichrome ABC transporter substrate-binding protein [Oceanospirillum linum]SEG33152.1 iron complex transport system substrate-binding protein [Oleiphilus messinensis]SMP29186.1 iron complex transport system substrate-binding protein [Oceanospirillum linum]